MSEDARPIEDSDDLLTIFHEGEKGGRMELLGTESEKFGILAGTNKPVSYDGRTCGILGFFEGLLETGEWQPVYDSDGGPLIALERDRAIGKEQISLEPGAQFELSGAPQQTVHGVADELRAHLDAIAPVSEACGVRWLSAGFHPTARPEQLPWVPKARYDIMKAYFPSVGTRGLDMMRRTATVQVNLDFHDEDDAMHKLRVALKASPIAAAIFASSPFVEGKISGHKSERTLVWTDTDRHRTGLLPRMMESGARYLDYVEWALDVPMYFFKREGKIVANTGQPFRDFMRDGYEGHHPTQADWVLHLNTLFPEVRLQKTLEVRCVDAQHQSRLPAVAAFWAGLLYDPTALDEAQALLEPLTHDELEAARAAVGREALAARVGERPIRDLAASLLAIAERGLQRRDRRDAGGRDERYHLKPMIDLVDSGRCPADLLVEGLDPDAPDLVAQIVERTAI